MANDLIKPELIAREALLQLENNMVMGNLVHRAYRDEFAKAGDTVLIRRPVQFDAKDGAELALQAVEEATLPVTVDRRKHVAWAFATQDLTLTIDAYADRYVRPAMLSLANAIDRDLCGLYAQVHNVVGTPGTVPSQFADLAAAARRLDLLGAPRDRRAAVLDTEAAWKLAEGLAGHASVASKAQTAMEQGALGTYALFDTYADQNVRVHTVGAHGGPTSDGPKVDGADQDVTFAQAKAHASGWGWTLICKGFANGAKLAVGDVITIAGVKAVNPVSREPLAHDAPFVVTQAVTASAQGAATVRLSPPCIAAGPQRTVATAPTDGAVISVIGAAGARTAQSLCFHRHAFALVTVPLEVPQGAGFAYREEAGGISIRVIKDYDIIKDEEVIRLDVLYGVAVLDPRLAVRLAG